MKKNILLISFIGFLLFSFFFTSCQTQTNQSKPEAISLLGQSLYPKVFDLEAKEKYEANLAKAKEDFDKDPDDPENIIWLGRRTAYLWRY